MTDCRTMKSKYSKLQIYLQVVSKSLTSYSLIYPNLFRLRVERIKRNQARLEQLGLANKSGAGVFGSLKPKKAPVAAKRKRKPELVILPKRSSRSRSAKKRIDYSRDTDFRLLRRSVVNPNATTRPRKEKPKRPRVVRWIHDEFRRISKQRRLNSKAAKRHVKAASKELKYWSRQMDSFLQKKRRHYDFERKQQSLQKERQELGGFTRLELLRVIDRRTPEMQRVLMQHNMQEASMAETEEQRLAFLERIKQQQALERKMQMIDALDRFPKSLKDATSSLNSMLYHRSPKDPPPPRRSKRNSDVAEENPASGKSPTKKKQGDDETPATRNEAAAGISWTNMVVEKPTVVVDASPPKRKKEVRNVGGWISPPLAKELDRKWLERQKALHNFDLNMYVPQVGDTVLYYPGLHQAFLEEYPDVLGKMTRNALRVPLWQRATKERSKKKSAEDNSWWSDKWIDSPNLAAYPLICRVERTHAEFPPDPYSHYKTIQKDGNVVWKLPKNVKTQKKMTGVQLAVLLKPLTPVLPPKFDAEKGFVEPNDLRLPPKFTVSTVPTKEPFLLPFVWLFALMHSVDEGDSIDLPNTDSTKAKIKKFHTLDEDAYGSFRLDDKISLIQSILESFQQPNNGETSLQERMEQAMAYEDSGRSFSATDASLAVDLLQSYLDGRKSVASTDAETSMQGSLLDLIRSTLPLSKGVEVMPNIYHRNTLQLSRWDFSAKRSARTEEAIPGLKAGLLHSLENALRIKIVCSVEDFIQRTEHAEIFADKVTEEVAPGYYNAVPIGMHFDRILNRLKLDKHSTCYYTSVESVLSDIQAIADNCLLYNSLDSDIAKLCVDVISSVKRQVSDIFTKHVREQSNRIKTEQERRRFVLRNCDSPAWKEDDTKTRGKGRTVPDRINAPYEGQLYRKWLQRIQPDGSWHFPKDTASTDKVLDWVPQSGDIVHYSRYLHAQFVKGHIDSLAEEQCMVPRFSGAPDDSSTDDNGDSEVADGRDESSEKLLSHWVVATVVGVRSSFPRTPEKKDSFDSPCPILVIGLRFPYSWAKGKVHYVCWRPCNFESEVETYTCGSCALGNSSFLRPAWLDQDGYPGLAILEGFDATAIDGKTKPLGIADSYSTGIAKCIDVLKRRCLNDVDPDHVDPKLCIENAERGELSTTKTSGSRSLPVFKDFLIHASNESPEKKKQTRDVPKAKAVKDKKSLELLSSINFLPPWSMHSIDVRKNDATAQHQTEMPLPCLCLELVSLRLKNGYYRQPAAIVNDLIEAYVTTVFYALSKPASRKKNRLSTRKIVKYLNSSKGNFRPTKIIRTKEARSKTKKNESLANDIQSVSMESAFKDAEFQALSEEEKSWVAKVDKIRKLYAMVSRSRDFVAPNIATIYSPNIVFTFTGHCLRDGHGSSEAYFRSSSTEREKRTRT
jgi:hypothetical protein